MRLWGGMVRPWGVKQAREEWGDVGGEEVMGNRER